MSLALTMMNSLRSSSHMDKYENRGSRYGAFELFRKQTNDANSIITPEMNANFWGSIGRAFEVPVIDYDKNVTIKVGQARSIEVGDSENTSRMLTITPVTMAFGFTMFPTLFHNNEIGYQRDFNAKMMKYINALGAELDSKCLTKLNTERTKVLGNKLEFAFGDDTVLKATNAQKDDVLGALETLMNSNDFYDTVDVVGDMGLQAHINKLRQFGTYNEQNKQMEYMGKNLYFSNRLMADGNMAKGFAVNAGSVGLMWRVDREALYNVKSRTGREWASGMLPGLDIPIGTMYYESDGDFSGIAGTASADMTASHKQHFGYSVDVAIVCSYNSRPTEGASPILQFEIAKQ